MKDPRLRNVEKYRPPYPLNKFSADFALKLGKEVVYLLASRGEARLEGSDWEQIFARLIGAVWKPSNVGLDDIVLEQTAWGAKTVKNAHPAKSKKIRLISGRNSTIYSFGDKEITKTNPNELGEKVLSIYNERVASVRKIFKHVRTVVLVKSDDLLEVAAFEIETILHDPEIYRWEWNENDNLKGFDKKSNEHRFTWQPHGSQFTIVENVPAERLAIRIRKPAEIDREAILKAMNFDPTWVQIIPSAK